MSADYNELLKQVVDASRMQADIENIKASQQDMSSRIIGMLGDVSGELRLLRVDLQGVPDKIAACRTEMRNEVERDFPDRTDAIEMERRIEKQIEVTDRALSEQIAQVSTSLNDKIAESNKDLNTKLNSLESKVERQWVKVTATITALFIFAGVVAWVVQNHNLFLH